MAELLFEIFSEEIPARMQDRAGQDLVKLMDAALKESGLLPKDSRALTGPRRLTYVTDVETRSPDVSEERKGPRVGAPERALEGFMRGAGISDISQAETREDKKGEFYVAVIQKDGQDTADILRTAIPDVMARFPWPKSMKSADTDFRWVRPLRGLTVLLDGHSLDGIEVGGIASDAHVHGHRQMGAGPFEVSTLAEYEATLNGDGHVMTDRNTRKARVLEQARKVCTDAGLELVEDPGLLDEVTGLVEWPVALLGDMDPDFLELPDEVIRLTLKSHQKTFTVKGADGKLCPNFVIMANLETADGGDTIKAGNAKVISARLADAKFFQDEDRKQTLESYYDQLDEVVFHKKLGSVRDKAERVAALAREIAPHVGADPNVAERAAKLAKCDLVTQTVIEATSLQGQVGRWMYEAEGGDPDIAVAIEEHYKPQGPSDAVPINPVAVAVALADKIDTMSEFWAIGEKPTGSKDPFALRRAALGVVRIIVGNNLKMPVAMIVTITATRRLVKLSQTKIAERDSDIIEFRELSASLGFNNIGFASLSAEELDKLIRGDVDFEKYLENAGIHEVDLNKWSTEEAKTMNDFMAFLLDRLRIYLRDQSQRHDVIDAVISQGGDDLLAISQRVKALCVFLSNSDGENLVQGYKRAANILRAERKKSDETITASTTADYSAPEAKALADALNAAKPIIDASLDVADYPAALSGLANLREPIDAFFEAVVVNSDDADERARRLALLAAVVETFHRIADFSKLDG